VLPSADKIFTGTAQLLKWQLSYILENSAKSAKMLSPEIMLYPSVEGKSLGSGIRLYMFKSQVVPK
jgi:hypothetical protein